MADINGRSFIATLVSTTGKGLYPVGYLRDNSLAGDGWLIQSDDPQQAALRFDFIERVGDRLHYHISAAAGTYYAGAKVGVSFNGYLGFYQVAQVSDFWKVELTGDNSHPDYFQFVLRDHRGYRVGAATEPKGGFWTSLTPNGAPSKLIRFLNVETGATVYFQGRILRDV